MDMKTAVLPLVVALGMSLGGIARSADPPGGAASGGAASPPQPVYTRQGVFSIPFRIDGMETGGPQPAEVRLFVSEDLGLKWRNEAQVKPEQQSFGFRAPHDGEYWFSIRTIDRQGHSHPEGPYEAQLQVIVDTITPRLDLSAARGENGEIVARWHVLDTGLKADSFKLEYQSTTGESWQPLAIDAQSQRSAKYTLIGEATWMPPASSGPLLLRATASDEAGNSAVSQVQVKADRVARTDAGAVISGRTAGDRTQPAGSRPGGSLNWPADTSTDRTLDSGLPRATDIAGDRNPNQNSQWRPAGREVRWRTAFTVTKVSAVTTGLAAAKPHAE